MLLGANIAVLANFLYLAFGKDGNASGYITADAVLEPGGENHSVIQVRVRVRSFDRDDGRTGIGHKGI